ncbi:probable sugar phosphate/phosphate translocator at2g25520 [Phtheirospermum japonicum]|uniref:Probable sugar phosphate/phosphate translocator at2g25520 n=1 Tax=Phtheirospermum japonicum TaxID=374723 RepID=A0A830B7S2_9LAMI|nr:probable sugar phosphate/phosphate translocator at2g25520 [Phtheirospermum japonicum]
MKVRPISDDASFVQTKGEQNRDPQNSGSFGEIVKACWQGTPVAVKCTLPSLSDERLVIQDFRHEVNLLVKLRHPNIVQFLGAVTEKEPLMLVTEYLRGILKALITVAVYYIGILLKKDNNSSTMSNMLEISFEVALAAYGEAKYDLWGVFLQLGAVAFEATRLSGYMRGLGHVLDYHHWQSNVRKMIQQRKYEDRAQDKQIGFSVNVSKKLELQLFVFRG